MQIFKTIHDDIEVLSYKIAGLGDILGKDKIGKKNRTEGDKSKEVTGETRYLVSPVILLLL